MKDFILEIRKAFKKGDIEAFVVGNTLYINDVATGIEYRIHELKGRTPMSECILNTDKTMPKCPVCGRTVCDSYGNHYKYCPDCGIKLNYNNTIWNDKT